MGLGLLVALVVGSIVGSGIFGLPQNMASGTEDGAILLGWVITGLGTYTLARVHQMLSMRKPELNNGVYVYARALSGKYVGFNSAWGYWVNTTLMQATNKARTCLMHCLPAFHNLETEVGRQIHEKYGLSEIEVTDEVFESDAEQ